MLIQSMEQSSTLKNESYTHKNSSESHESLFLTESKKKK